MADNETDSQELAQLVKRLDRQRRARMAADAISEHATRALYAQHEHLKLLQAVAVAANESPSLDDALQAAVDQICTHLGWPVGHAYLAIGTTYVLALSDIWFFADMARSEDFRRMVESTLIAPRSGVAGRALDQRAPVTTNDLASVLPAPLAASAAAAGLQSAIAFPIIGDGVPVAVLEFFMAEPLSPDEMLVGVIAKIGDLLGNAHVRTRQAATLRNSSEQYRLLFEGNPNPMLTYDAESLDLIAVNDAVTTQYGYSRDELLGMSLIDLQLPADRGKRDGLMKILKKDGNVLTVEMSGYDVRLPGRRARLAMAVDADAGRRSIEELRESERRFREMLDNIELLAVLLDVVGTVTYCNPYLLKLTGYSKNDVLGRNFFELFLPVDRRANMSREFLTNIGRGIIAAHDESDIVTRRDDRRVIRWNNTVLRNAQGSILGAASLGTDVTEQRLAEQELLHNAFHDSLSGLPNRALFLDRVDHALNRLRRDGRHQFAVLLLDVDDFKNVNDSLGHGAGDELLVAIGRRLTASVRGADTVARFGGDEFTVLIEDVGAMDVTRAAARIHTDISVPFHIGENEIFTSASIGIINGSAEYDGPEQILRDADTAMYRAKAQGRGRSEIFDAAMRADAVARLQLETDLRRAIDREELLVLYQPIVRLGSGQVVGFEALVRWLHPVRGMISPGDFIPAAEETGLIVPMGEYVLREACRQAARWPAGRGNHVHVSVNISSKQFAHSDLISQVRSALKSSQLPASALHFEITESVIMHQPENALELIKEIRALGCRIALDDFGTGYSSLGYLHRFPIDRLKIDSSFVRDAPRNKKNVEIIRSVIGLGGGLGIEVVAEGIETAEEHDLLRSLGCEMGQGYLFSRPVPAERAFEIMREK